MTNINVTVTLDADLWHEVLLALRERAATVRADQHHSCDIVRQIGRLQESRVLGAAAGIEDAVGHATGVDLTVVI